MFKRLLAKFHGDERGNFALLFGLLSVPMIVMMGVGIDFYARLSYRARYDAAADAASIAAANTAQAYMTANASSQTAATTLFSNARAAGLAAAAKVFAANAGTAALQVPVTPQFDLVQLGAKLTATTTYSGSMKANFGRLIGIKTASVANTSVASLAFTTYVNYYVLVDTSGSMGIGDTAEDMKNLYNATAGSSDGGSCVFACHGHFNWGDTSPDHLAIARGAKNPTISLRIDSARSAVRTMITQAQTSAGDKGNIKIGLYTMELNGAAKTYIKKVSDPPSASYASLLTSADTIDLPLFVNNNSDVPGWTDAKNAITALAALIPASGNGLTASTPINYAFIISDGLQDTYGTACSSTDNHCAGPVSLTACSALKAQATVGTIYTTYLPIYNNNNSANGLNGFYKNEVLPYASQIAPNMKDCASDPSLFFQADDGPALINALQKLFASTNRPVALSQ